MTLFLHGQEVSNFFGLFGNNENSASYALGWNLEQSATYCGLLTKEIFGEDLEVSAVEIALQGHDGDGGYTDIEMKSGREFHAIVEAKRSWGLPGTAQFERYLPRLVSGGAKRQRLVSVGAASQDYAQKLLPSRLGGVAIRHFSWGDLQNLARKAETVTTRRDEKLWLRALIEHLKEYASMTRQNDNKVFVVALSSAPVLKGQEHTFIDVVEKDQTYFHPVGDHWPKEPPNYIGFRYRGRLQSVHHIDSARVVRDVSTCNASWCKTDKDHFVYRLGPAMRPAREIRTGNLFRAQQVECAIDTLLSGAFDTIKAARDETKRRLSDLD